MSKRYNLKKLAEVENQMQNQMDEVFGETFSIERKTALEFLIAGWLMGADEGDKHCVATGCRIERGWPNEWTAKQVIVAHLRQEVV